MSRGVEPHTSCVPLLRATNAPMVMSTVAKCDSARMGRIRRRSTSRASATAAASAPTIAAAYGTPASMRLHTTKAGMSPISAMAKLGTSVARTTRTRARAIRAYQPPDSRPLRTCSTIPLFTPSPCTPSRFTPSASHRTAAVEVLPSGTAPLTRPDARTSMGPMDVSSLGYLRITADDPHNWAGFAAHVLGMQVVPGDGDVLHLRMDDRHHRIAIEPAGPSGNGDAAAGFCYGWEVADAGALDAAAGHEPRGPLTLWEAFAAHARHHPDKAAIVRYPRPRRTLR